MLTLVAGREAHLRNLVHGLARSSTLPAELIVASMDGRRPALPEAPFRVRVIDALGDHELPFAAARNSAALVANGEGLVFLDVDCIPSRGLVGAYETALTRCDGLAMGGVRYLRPGTARENWTEADLTALSDAHPGRPEPGAGLEPTERYDLFWSLSFGVRRSTLLGGLGGFDESFSGYGGEDTDLGFTARARGVPLAWLGGATCFHQHHETERMDRHAASIVANARRFHEKWGEWPMQAWLAQLASRGAIDWSPAEGEIAVTG